MTAAEMLTVPTVSLVDKRPATTSLDIAEHFDKRHTDVMRSIRNLCTDLPADVRERNFAPTFRTVAGPNNSERQEEFFTVFFDGFILLVMGYTGKKALGMKLAYIEAFNAMREELERAKTEPVENLDKLPASDSPLTPDQQCTLQAIVKAKIEALPREQRGGLYPKTWSRFNNHFRLAKYCQLPQSRMSEAVAYLTQMNVAEGKQALPSVPTVSTLETVETHLATIRAHIREIMDCERSLYFALRDTLPPLRGVTRPFTLRLHESLDSGFTLLDVALKQAENTAKLALEYARS